MALRIGVLVCRVAVRVDVHPNYVLLWTWLHTLMFTMLLRVLLLFHFTLRAAMHAAILA